MPKELTNEEKLDIWEAFENTYYKDSLHVFKMIRKQRDLVFEGYNEI